MSTRAVWSVHCDFPGCVQWAGQMCNEILEARSDARARGWYVCEERSFCPEHVESGEHEKAVLDNDRTATVSRAEYSGTIYFRVITKMPGVSSYFGGSTGWDRQDTVIVEPAGQGSSALRLHVKMSSGGGKIVLSSSDRKKLRQIARHILAGRDQ